tara:strand:+ start:717 stop:1511 length:795 start_codon:yes stop_codon:yes gene_type:complete
MIPYTHCKGCVFAQMGEFTQESCSLNRASKLGVQDKDEEGFFVLSRFCAAYRPQEWVNELSDEEQKDKTQTVMDEISPCVGFFVLLETNKENAIQKLESTLKDIQNQEKIKPKYVVVINDKTEYNQDVFHLLRTMFDIKETKYHIVQLREKPATKWHKLDPAFIHAKNGWIYVTSSGEKIDKDLIYKIHKRVNIDMKRLVVVKPYEDMNGMIFQTALFKFVNGNGTKLYQDEMIDSRSFLEKVESAARDSGQDTFIEWSEFNES